MEKLEEESMQQEFGAFRVEPPGLRIPVALILDDPAPCRNAMYFHGGFRGNVAEIPNTFVTAFAETAARTGMSGKFTVLPYPFGLGWIDRQLMGIAERDLHEFLAIVRERIAPTFDISSEILTHWNALDLSTMSLLPWWEREWVRWQSRETLTDYISLSLEILNNVAIPANGVTSPWDTGITNEDDYSWAIGAAGRRVNGQKITWYFLHDASKSPSVAPQLWHLDRARGEAVVSIITCAGDALWNTQKGEPAQIDRWITEDGTGGRLVEACHPDGILAFCTHWQSLFSNGSWAGLHALETVAERINMHLGKRTRWMRCSDIARYATTAACLTYTEPTYGSGKALHLHSPVECDGYTISLPLQANQSQPRGITVGQGNQTQELRHTDDELQPGSWTMHDGRVALCWNFGGDDVIRVEEG